MNIWRLFKIYLKPVYMDLLATFSWNQATFHNSTPGNYLLKHLTLTFLRFGPLGLYFLQHTVLVYKTHVQWNFQIVLMFLLIPLVDVDHRTSAKGEVEACIILNHLFPEKVTWTCTHLMKRWHLLLPFGLLWSTHYSNDNNVAMVIYCHMYAQTNTAHT